MGKKYGARTSICFPAIRTLDGVLSLQGKGNNNLFIRRQKRKHTMGTKYTSSIGFDMNNSAFITAERKWMRNPM